MSGRAPLQRADRGFHACAGGDAVIDDDGRAAVRGSSRPVAKIDGAAPLDFAEFGLGAPPDFPLANSQRVGDFAIDDEIARFAVHGGGERQFRIGRRADLSHQDQVERRLERARDGRADRDAAAGQGVNHGMARRAAAERAGEKPPGGGPVVEQEELADAGNCRTSRSRPPRPVRARPALRTDGSRRERSAGP